MFKWRAPQQLSHMLCESAGEMARLKTMKRTRHSAEQIVRKLHDAATATSH